MRCVKGKNSCGTVHSAVSESRNLVLLFAAFEGLVSNGFVCYTTYCFIRLVTPFSRRSWDKLRDRLHFIVGLSHEHKCLSG